MSRSILEASCQSTTSTWGRDSDQLESCKARNLSEKRENAALRIRDVYSGSRIRIFPSRIQGQKYSGSASKKLSIFNPKNCFKAVEKMIWDVHHGSRIRIFPITDPNPGSKGQKTTGSRIHGSKRHRIPDSGSATLRESSALKRTRLYESCACAWHLITGLSCPCAWTSKEFLRMRS